ncbi:hypothetical protein CROQUDRAFT_324709 [Cronartium quercuum f. sp. fusiforme G11]|uniref:DH domain-containing protein n=1 Tax=Cronartium quercuum f. sp. fusiforme G11 TaxID=708437 RepID=A0A9P6T6Y3_9BASI|nr:hypothetical protein CROQUDRAFT_324709 [Cronartium quercuum f. sp. fusiforme G11]
MHPLTGSPIHSRRRPFSTFAASTPNLNFHSIPTNHNNIKTDQTELQSESQTNLLAHLASQIPLVPIPDSNHPPPTTKSTLVDVVVEGMGGGTDPGQGWQVPPELVTFLRSLGDRLDPLGPTTSPSSRSSTGPVPHTKSLTAALNHATLRPQTDHSAILALFTELVLTERTYLKRITALNQSYAIPLRQFSKSSSTKIIDKWEATTMFGKIDGLVKASTNLLPVLESALNELQEGKSEGWSDALAAELVNIQRPYRDYLAGYDTVKDAEQKLLKKSEGFRQFCERTKEAMYDDGLGRVGLRELLMEPVQRVTRYILIFEQILRKMSSSEPARTGLLEAITTCNRLAICELEDVHIRAATLWGLSRAIEHFPAILVKPGRYLLDALDVLDVIPHATTPTALPCTLFLFNDTILIAKKPVTSAPGRTLAGLDDLDRLVGAMKKHKGSSALTAGTDFLAKSLGASVHATPTKVKKGSMRFKGLADVHDIIVSNQPGPGSPGGEVGFELFFSRPPCEVSERWAGRPVRHYLLATPAPSLSAKPGPASSPLALLAARDRFLGNLRKAQALVKAAEERSTVMRTRFKTEQGSTLENFWNLYDKRTYLLEQRKHRVVLQLVGTDAVERLSFERDFPDPGPPMLVVRACFNEPEDPDCIVSVRVRTGLEPSIGEEEEVVKTDNLSSLVIRLIERYRLADIPTPFSPVVAPSHTPSGSPARALRSRAGSTTASDVSRRRLTQPLARARSITTATAPASTRSPGGPVWYRNLEAMKEEVEGEHVGMKQSDSNPSLEEEQNQDSEAESSVSGLSSAAEGDEEQDTPRKLRGPRQLGFGRVLGADKRTVSGSSIGKRTERVSDTEESEDEAEDERTQTIKRVAGVGVEKVDESKLSPGCGRVKKLERSPSSERRRDERRVLSRRRRNGKTKVGPEDLPEVMMEDVDGAEDLFRSMRAKVEKMKGYIKRETTEGSSAMSPVVGGTIPRSPRKKQLLQLMTESGSGLDKTLEGLEADVCSAERTVQEMRQSITDFQTAFQSTQAELERTKNELRRSEASAQVLRELHDALEIENCHLYEAFNEELDKMYHDVQLPPGQAIGLLVEDLKRTAEEKGKLVTQLGYVLSLLFLFFLFFFFA